MRLALGLQKITHLSVTYATKKEGPTERYDQVNAMLLNEFLKEHRTVKDQGATIEDLKREVENLIGVVKEQATQIEQLSAEVHSDRVASQVALNKR